MYYYLLSNDNVLVLLSAIRELYLGKMLVGGIGYGVYGNFLLLSLFF